MNEQAIIDATCWPLVYYRMPEEIPDTEAERHMQAMEAVLERRQPFVLIFSGVELPKNSAKFFRLYKAWNRLNYEQQKTWCRGAIRIEPDAAKRHSLWRKALRYLASRRIPYPYKIVASPTEADTQARCWLT